MVQEMARKQHWYENVSTVLLSPDTQTENEDPEQEVINAVNRKYDSLKDKLILEVSTGYC